MSLSVLYYPTLCQDIRNIRALKVNVQEPRMAVMSMLPTMLYV